MKYLIIYFVLMVSNSFSQKIEIFYEKVNNKVFVYSNNTYVIPYSLYFEYELNNLKTPDTKIFVIEPKNKKQLLFILEVENLSKGYRFSYTYKSFKGNTLKSNNPKNFIYDLPFKGVSKITQGYNGTRTHKSRNALDFLLPVGTKLFAIRSGIVTDVIEKNSKHCYKKGCEKFNNYIEIYHNDGTFSTYQHIKKNGAIVNIGDAIKRGQHIGYSGNVGYSSGPHLHLEIFRYVNKKYTTLKTKFKTGNGQIEYLKEGEIYSRNY